eukprot:1160902-Pelagomonas_calceolata.AAC.10
MDVGSADRLAQHDMHITEQISNRIIPPYLFDPSIPDHARRTSSHPHAILVTPCPANPNRPPTPSSHRVLHSMRRNEVVRSNTTPARQPHELSIQNCHIHLLEIKHCKNTRPGAQLEASQQQHSELRRQLQGLFLNRSCPAPGSMQWDGSKLLGCVATLMKEKKNYAGSENTLNVN